jgi:hypothetical protein
MNTYAEESDRNFPKTKLFELKPDPRFELKLKNAARRVVTQGNNFTRLHLAGWANLDISDPVLKYVINLEPAFLPEEEYFDEICNRYLDSRENEDKTRQIAYAAFLGVLVQTELE